MRGTNQTNTKSSFFKILIAISLFGGCYYYVNDNKNYSYSNEMTTKHCDKHSVTYSPKNAYGGCPKCSNEKFAKEAADAMEKKLYGH